MQPSNTHLLASVLVLAKTVLLFEHDLMGVRTSWIFTGDEVMTIARRVFEIWRSVADVNVKVRCAEVVAVMLYRGEIEMLELIAKQSDKEVDLFVLLVNEINNCKARVEPFNVGRIHKKLGFDQIENILRRHNQFERILNVNNLALDKNVGTDTEVEGVAVEYYKYVLLVTFVVAMKVSAHYKLPLWIEFFKSLVNYKHMSAFTQMELRLAEQTKGHDSDQEDDAGPKKLEIRLD